MKKVVLLLSAIVALCFSSCNKDEDEKFDVTLESNVVIGSKTIAGDMEKWADCEDWIANFDKAVVEFADKHTHKYNIKAGSYEKACNEAADKYLQECYEKDLADAKSFVEEWQNKLSNCGIEDVIIRVSLTFRGRGIYCLGDYNPLGTVLKTESLKDLEFDSSVPE